MSIIALIGVIAPIVAEAVKAGRTIATADDLTPEEIDRIRAAAAETHAEFDDYVAHRLGGKKVES